MTNSPIPVVRIDDKLNEALALLKFQQKQFSREQYPEWLFFETIAERLRDARRLLGVDSAYSDEEQA